ncbi:MAG: hypothetical protein AAFQ77_03725 [Myxococcota bacterium]
MAQQIKRITLDDAQSTLNDLMRHSTQGSVIEIISSGQVVARVTHPVFPRPHRVSSPPPKPEQNSSV